ncbi:hypothetical protein JB92DRAFT_2825678 [Gautieria morchelliformis]|nr:hypothetical protein JB92DRAFT_2825678 [Gautieria morchelliformis]
MFLLRVRPFVSARRTASAASQLHTSRPVAADFASYGKSATPGAKPDQVDGAATTPEYTYTKQQDVTPEPRVSHTGTRTYVVSPKDSSPYDVPGGAYGSSDPYLTPPQTPAPQTSAPSSTSSAPAHPNTTSRVPHDPDGVGESAAVRYRTAPGQMHTRGGSEGGLGLMDTARSQATHQHNTLAERNLPPSDEGGRLGNSEAWKHRK